MSDLSLKIRPGTRDDLDAINAVIESAVLNWPMAERVKRLSLSSLKYDATDLSHLEAYVCERGNEIIGVATLDHHHGNEDSQGLLHGLYVLPIVQGQGIGRRLLRETFENARRHNLDTVFVRAERVSAEYFRHQDLESIEPANDAAYPYLFSKTLKPAA
jgi:N-acetylglutamate synthase-like GNAT family acetyltransferase